MQSPGCELHGSTLAKLSSCTLFAAERLPECTRGEAAGSPRQACSP